MSNHRYHKVDTDVDLDWVGEVEADDVKQSDDIYAVSDPRPAMALDHARHIRNNVMQNSGRAWFAITSGATPFTITAGSMYVPPWSTFSSDFAPVQLRMFKLEANATSSNTGLAFVCQESGWYDIDGFITIEISSPAVPATLITQAECALLWQRPSIGSYSYLTQCVQYASVQGVVGPPPATIQFHMLGWSHHVKDQLYFDVGDKLWLIHGYTGLGAITYVERYEGHLAIQRTAEPIMNEECCTDAS